MNGRVSFALSAGFFAFCSLLPPSPAGAQFAQPATTQPIRHLVYAFTFSSDGDLQDHNATGIVGGNRRNGRRGASPTSGGSPNVTHGAGFTQDYQGSLSDNGTITVDVMKEQPDRGLILTISEQSQQTRSASPALCAVYGNTITIVCDPNKTVNSEEMTLLRFLGTTFVDPNQIDAKQHWKIDDSNGLTATVADYTIEKADNGIMKIGESRVIKGLNGPSMTTNISSKIDYDFSRLVPTAVDEYSIARLSRGTGSTMTTTVQTTLSLQSDSMH